MKEGDGKDFHLANTSRSILALIISHWTIPSRTSMLECACFHSKLKIHSFRDKTVASADMFCWSIMFSGHLGLLLVTSTYSKVRLLSEVRWARYQLLGQNGESRYTIKLITAYNVQSRIEWTHCEGNQSLDLSRSIWKELRWKRRSATRADAELHSSPSFSF